VGVRLIHQATERFVDQGEEALELLAELEHVDQALRELRAGLRRLLDDALE
jgi:hypothetical protein